jgi:hypothetical protein
MKQIQHSIFQFLADLFRENGIHAVLVGGYAMNAYRLQRMTFDIDFMICEKDLDKIKPVLLSVGYEIFNQTNAFVQFKSNQQGLRDIDLLLVDENTLSKILSQGKTVHFAQSDFIVPSAVHLLAMKLHAIHGNKDRRIKDIPDISHLVKSGEINLSDGAIRQIFEKYEALELYNDLTKDAL